MRITSVTLGAIHKPDYNFSTLNSPLWYQNSPMHLSRYMHCQVLSNLDCSKNCLGGRAYTRAKQSSQMWDLKAVGKSSPSNNSTKAFHSTCSCSMSFFHSGLQLLTNKTDIVRLHQPQGAFNAQGWLQVTQHEQTQGEATGTGTAGLWTFTTCRATCNTNPSFCPCPPLWQSSRQPRCLQRIAHSGLAGAPKPGWVALRVPPPSQSRPPEPRERWLSPHQLQRSISLQSASHWAFLIKPAEGKEKKKEGGLKADEMTDGKSAKSCCLWSRQTSHLWCDAGNYKATTWQSGTCYPEEKRINKAKFPRALHHQFTPL